MAAILGMGTLGLSSLAARAQGKGDYPACPVRLIVGFAADGGNDILAPVLGERLAKVFGQPFAVKNRPTVGGGLAASYVMKEAADGYTLRDGASSALAIAPAVYTSCGKAGSGTDHVTVFFHSGPQRSVSTVVTLPEATSDTMVLIRAATRGLRRVWQDGSRYSKAGVITVDLVSLERSPRALESGRWIVRTARPTWMRSTAAIGAGEGAPSWQRRSALSRSVRGRRSSRCDLPRCTTRLNELPVVRAA